MQINSTCFNAWNFGFFPSQNSRLAAIQKIVVRLHFALLYYIIAIVLYYYYILLYYIIATNSVFIHTTHGTQNILLTYVLVCWFTVLVLVLSLTVLVLALTVLLPSLKNTY